MEYLGEVIAFISGVLGTLGVQKVVVNVGNNTSKTTNVIQNVKCGGDIVGGNIINNVDNRNGYIKQER